MRTIYLVQLVLSVLVVAACAQGAAPTLPPSHAPTEMAAAGPEALSTATPPLVAGTPVPTTGSALEQPVAPPTSPGPPADDESDLSWPQPVAALDFGVPAGNSYGPRALVVHPGLRRLYARTHPPAAYGDEPGLVTVFDLDTGEVLDVVETGPDGYAEGGLVVDTVRDRVYALNPGDTTATALDARTLAVLGTLDGVDCLALDETTGTLYAAGLSSLRALDAATGTLLTETSLEAYRYLSLTVDRTAGRVYLAHEIPAGGFALSAFDATTLGALFDVPLPGRPQDLLTAGDDTRQLFVTLDDGEHNLLWVLDAGGELLEESTLGEWTQHTYLALDAAGDRLFLSQDAYNREGVLVRDLNDGRMERLLDLEHAPGGLAWDADRERLFASLTYVDRLVAVDPSAREVADTLPAALTLVDVAADPVRGALLVTDSAGELHVLEADGSAELARLSAGGLISVDSRHGRYYTGGAGTRQVRIVDADTLQVSGTIDTRAAPVADPYHDDTFYLVRSGVYVASLDTLTTTMAISDTLPQSPGFSPNPAAVNALVDPDSGQLLVLINNGVPGSNNGNYLYVYEPDTYERIFQDGERSPIYLAVDPTSDRAYVSRVYMDMRSTSMLVDGREYADRIDALFGPLQVDPGLGILYLTLPGDAGGELVLLATGDEGDPGLDVVGSVPIPGGFTLRAIDTDRHLLYLGTQGGQLEIWSTSGGGMRPPEHGEEPALEPAPLPLETVSQFYVAPGTGSIFAGNLYRSDDDGQTWYSAGPGLPLLGIGDLVISPGFADDETLFVAGAIASSGNLGVWKSDTGGRTWRMANDGLDDLGIVDLAISPDFARDGTLFALARKQGLFRSTDGGQTWQTLADRYLPAGPAHQYPGLLALSPTYRQDQTLYVAHEGLHRSTDGGETWTQVMDTGPESLAFAPDYASSHVVYGWFGDVGLLRSEDGGDRWQPVSAGLLIDGFGSPRLFVPAGDAGGDTLYFFWDPSSPEGDRQLWRTTDAGRTWQRLVDVPHSITRLVPASDGSTLLSLDDGGHLVRHPFVNATWESPPLPPLTDIVFDDLVLPPNFSADGQAPSTSRVLYAVNRLAGVLFSPDAGITWSATGYPQRHLFSPLVELLVLPSGDALAATPRGLYHYTPGGEWIVVAEGLPAGAPVTGLARGGDGSLHLVVTRDRTARVFLSTDDGRSWTEPAPALREPTIADDFSFSPTFARDLTVFAAVSQRKPLRSTGGGSWQEIGPPGEWATSAFDVSPALDRDAALFLRTDAHGFWRSTDLGDTWQQVQGPWGEGVAAGIAAGSGYWLPALTFSPDFGTDRVAFTQVNNTIYRTSDAGETWRAVLDLVPGIVHAAFSPDYATDRTLFVVQGQRVYRSMDRGAMWQVLSTPPWSAFDEMQVEVSPTFTSDRTLLTWSLDGLVYLSHDAGQSWRVVSAGLPPDGLKQVTLSPAYAADGLIYALPYAGGIYRYTGDNAWQLATQPRPASRATPTPTAPAPPPAPTAAPSPAPPACQIKPGRFEGVWRAHSGALGCPNEVARELALAEQAFEHGRMIWDSEEHAIYVLLDEGTWQAFEDTWQEGEDPSWDPNLPPPPRQPQRGFGKVWREELGGPDAPIGWAVEAERGVAGWRQRFETGHLYWTDAQGGTVYLLYDDGTWE